MNINNEKPYVLHDNFNISAEVEAMSLEERRREIARLEAEGRKNNRHVKQDSKEAV